MWWFWEHELYQVLLLNLFLPLWGLTLGWTVVSIGIDWMRSEL